MNNVLIIAYYFPPSGGPGVQRVLKHVKYLPEFGWNPIVLTVENGQFPARDESLLEKIPKSVQVYRTKIFEPYDIYRAFTGKSKDTAIDVNVINKEGTKLSSKDKLAEFIRATFFIPDARIGWLFTAKQKALDLIYKYNIRAVYSSSPPYTCSMIARYVKRSTGIPWIAGLRDPWTDFLTTPNRWFLPAAIDRSMEKSCLTEANFVEAAWEGIIKDALGKYPDLPADKFIHIPNGYDSSDFPKVESGKNEKFTVTYTGSMYGRRNPHSFIKAVEFLLEQNKIDITKLHFRFIGRFGEEVHQMIDNSKFRSNIEKIEYLPHSTSIEYLMKSDALLLIVDESKESEEIVPGKVYEYLGVQRPVITVAPKDGAVAGLINSTKAGLVAHQSDIEGIADIYLDFYSKWINNKQITNPDMKLIQSYERRNAAYELSKLLQKTIEF